MKKILIITILLMVLYLISFVYLFPLLHDKKLEEISSLLTNVELPQETNILSTGSKVGHQIGNSDHCDYFAYLVIKSNLTNKELTEYYKSKNLDIEILFKNNLGSYQNEKVDHDEVFTLKELVDSNKAVNYTAIIFVFKIAETSSFDLRCS